jgi:uncharacterized protein with PQ loop repeat
MRLIYFVLGVICIITAGLLSMGQLQKVVEFRSVDSEIFMFILCSICSIFFLIYSIQEDENGDK